MRVYFKKVLFYIVRYPILVLLAFNFSIYIFLHFAISNELKVQIRQALATSPLKDPRIFLAPPDSLPFFNFSSYKEEKLVQFFKKNKTSLQRYYKVSDTLTIVEKAKEVALSYSKNGGKGCGEYSEDLMKNIEWTTTGGGCCSDHSQVFIALSLLNGVYAREVNHTSHTFNEFWDSEKNNWVWIDPQLCLLAKDGNGNYLSLFQIYSLLKESAHVKWEFFGTSSHELYKKDPAKHNYYQPDQFKSIHLTMSNRVFLEDSWNKKLWFLPRDLRQIILITVGVGWRYAIWGFNSVYFVKLENTRSVVLIFIALILLVNFTLIYYTYKYKTGKHF